MNKKKIMEKKDRIWFFISEFFMIIGILAVGQGIITKNYFHIVFGTLNGILWMGTRDLYISKFNIKPFYYNWLSKKKQEEFP